MYGGKIMKNKNIMFKLIMFISSYFPLFVMIIILWNKKICQGFREKNTFWIVFSVVVVIMIFMSIFSVIFLKKGNYSKRIDIKQISRPDDTVLSYVMTYVIPLVSGEGSSNEVFIVNFLLFILIGYIYIRLNLIYLNPLWAIFGYTIYKMEDECIIITDIPFTSIRHMSSIKGYFLSNGVFVVNAKHNGD